MKILLIEDDPIAQDLICDILEPYQCDVQRAADCLQGFALLQRSGPYDIALVDWNTPHMSGIDFLRHTRATTEWQQLPVIMITGNADAASIREALTQGVTEYVMKPYTPQMLLDKMRMAGVSLIAPA